MKWAMEILLALILAVFLIGGSAVIFYVSTLAKSAYAIKIQLKADLEHGLRQLEDEQNKNNRWLKRDLVDDLEKSKAALAQDGQRRLHELAEQVEKKLVALNENQITIQSELSRAIEVVRGDVHLVGRTVAQMRKSPPAAAPPVAAPVQQTTPSPQATA